MTYAALPKTTGRVHEILAGRAIPFGGQATLSAIQKHPITGEVRIMRHGIECDEQGDRRIHGGVDKAIHCYPFEHYSAWRSEISHVPVLGQVGAFGENLSLSGLVEQTVCLGDIWCIGTTQLVVTQGRQPCWKLNIRFGVTDMARRVQDSLRAGWYMRVEQEGILQAGDPVVLLGRPHPNWPIARLLDLIRDRVTDTQTLEEVLCLPLVPSWQHLFQNRLRDGIAEAWGARMDGHD